MAFIFWARNRSALGLLTNRHAVRLPRHYVVDADYRRRQLCCIMGRRCHRTSGNEHVEKASAGPTVHSTRRIFSNISAGAEGLKAQQQTTGVPGSPSATTTVNGIQLPAPPPKFGGVIDETLQGSKTWWPPRVVPRKGAPNVLLIMTDDQGYGVSGTFGGVIPTPALDRVSESRAALYGVQLHRSLLAHPGVAHHRPQPPLGRLRRDHGAVNWLPRL